LCRGAQAREKGGANGGKDPHVWKVWDVLGVKAKEVGYDDRRNVNLKEGKRMERNSSSMI